MTDAMNLSTLAFPPTTEHRLFTPSRPGPAIGDTPEAEVPTGTATPPAPHAGGVRSQGRRVPLPEDETRASRRYSYTVLEPTNAIAIEYYVLILIKKPRLQIKIVYTLYCTE